MQRALRIRLSTLLLAASLACACGDDTQNGSASPARGKLEIAGHYHDSFGEDVVISDAAWDTTSADGSSNSKVIEFDNDKNFAITQNAADDKSEPNKFNKNVWTEPKPTASITARSITGSPARPRLGSRPIPPTQRISTQRAAAAFPGRS